MGSLNLYENDFYAWIEEQARLIKDKEFDKLDLANLLEEVESMGKHEKRELSSRLTILLMHLLKWKYQPPRQCKSWVRTIKEQRLEVEEVLAENPSLRNIVNQHLAHAYQIAILKAADEINLDEDTFPVQCEWTITDVLDKNFYPS